MAEKSWRHHFFTTQGHITPKWLIRSSHNSNLSEILCLSSLPVSLMETEFIVTEKRWKHHFPIQSRWECSRAINSAVKSSTWPEFELIQDFMPVLTTCKFDKDLIKDDWENMATPFFPLYVNGSFLLPWLPQFWWDLPQNLSPTPKILLIKFD